MEEMFVGDGEDVMMTGGEGATVSTTIVIRFDAWLTFPTISVNFAENLREPSSTPCVVMEIEEDVISPDANDTSSTKSV